MAIARYQDQLKLKKKRHRITKLCMIMGAIFLFISIIGYFIFFAKIFDVRSLTISGVINIDKNLVEKVVNDWLDQKIMLIKKRNNLSFFSTESLKKLLAKKFLEINSVVVNKKGKHELEINMEERIPIGIWCLEKNAGCYYFDANGIGYASVGNSEGFIFLIINDRRDRNVNIGEQMASTNLIQNIIKIKDLLTKEKFEVLEVVILPDDEFEVRVSNQLKTGLKVEWVLIFNNKTDVTSQFAGFFKIIDEKLNLDQMTKIKLFDLRIQDRIYYK